jgi:hypothetical protein
MRLHSLFVVVLGAVTLPALAAQEPDRPARPDPETFEMRLDGPEHLMRIVMDRRARLGIKVNLRAQATDSIGAYVDAVTPGGPAAKAGIRSGDLITKLDGQSVLAGGQAEADEAGESMPGLRLVELAARLQPNDTVAVEFRRGKDRRTVSVVTEDEPGLAVHGRSGPRAFGFRFFRPRDPGTGYPLETRDEVEDLMPGHELELLSRAPLAQLELAPLNPDLGQYFGTSDGVLVISAPKDSALGLKGGDVVLAVDGRKPAGPSHLLRILRSYDQGESFKVDLLRNRKRETITARLGGH